MLFDLELPHEEECLLDELVVAGVSTFNGNYAWTGSTNNGFYVYSHERLNYELTVKVSNEVQNSTNANTSNCLETIVQRKFKP